MFGLPFFLQKWGCFLDELFSYQNKGCSLESGTVLSWLIKNILCSIKAGSKILGETVGENEILSYFATEGIVGDFKTLNVFETRFKN